MEKIKILLTTDPEIPVPPKYYGGAERLASDLIDEYTKLGHDVYLIANKNSTQKNVVKVYAWPADSSTGWSNVLKNALFLRDVYFEIKPDIIHSFSRIIYLYLLTFTRAKFVKRYGRLISRKSTWLAKIIFGKRIQFISAAAHMLNHLSSKEHWKVIYNFVDTDYYTPDQAVEKNGLVFVGRIEDIKGVHEAIQVAQKAGEPLIIAGNIEPEHQGYFESKVKPYLDERIKYVGEVNNEQKRRLFQKAKATLFPIKWEEPFGIVMAESLSCGTPVVAFRCGSVPEIVKSEENGFVCNSIQEMVDSIKKLNKLDQTIIRQDAIDRFNRGNAAQQYLEVFKEMIAKQH